MTPEQIVEANTDLAKQLATCYAEPYAPNDYDEMLSAAYLALVQVAQTDSPSDSYIGTRMIGEILDTKRRNDPLGRIGRLIFEADQLYNGDVDAIANQLDIPPEEVVYRLGFIHPRTPMPTEYEDDRGLEEAIEVCLQYIPQDLHDFFLLYYRDQLSIAQVAETMGYSYKWTWRKIQDALELLRLHSEELSNILL